MSDRRSDATPMPQRQDTILDMTNTSPMSRRAILGTAPLKQHAYLEITGPDKSIWGVELGEVEVELGRSSDCQVQLLLGNVSRRHSRIRFFNDEYHLEDIGSTNGTFVNGVKVLKCVLRNNDVIEIGEAKILFVEEKTRQRL
jgi:pSer/pThr/pTyr-binding forkhead associated (FHA) protein